MDDVVKLGEASTIAEVRPRGPSEIATIVFTSGTNPHPITPNPFAFKVSFLGSTGTPKGAVHTEKSWFSQFTVGTWYPALPLLISLCALRVLAGIRLSSSWV